METYFITIAGVSAALTGLIFVSLSINLHQILAFKHLPSRALSSLMLMANIPLVASFCLVAGQPVLFLGMEVLIFGLTLWLVITRMDIQVYKERMTSQYRNYYIFNVILTQLAILPYLISGIFFLTGSNVGAYWLIPAFTISIIKALTDSWVLLVEINR